MKSFLYLHASDVSVARHFYSELLGLEEIVAADDVVGYRIGTLQLTIAQHDEPSRTEGWAGQLGWQGGTSPAPSWGFEVEDEAFGRTVDRLRGADVPCWGNEPAWVGYWSFPVTDPMGNTVEVSAAGEGAWTAGA